MLECTDAVGQANTIAEGRTYKQIGEMYRIGDEMWVNIEVNGESSKGYYAKRFKILPNFERLALFSSHSIP